MYYVYSLRCNEAIQLLDGFCVRNKKISPFESIHALLWSFFKGSGAYHKVVLSKNGVDLCVAEVIEKCPFLRFLPDTCVHIGPCFTPVEHRGNGYYPMLIKYIASCNKDKECYMFVHMDNMASIRGIEKAGFNKVGVCKKFLNIYYPVSE